MVSHSSICVTCDLWSEPLGTQEKDATAVCCSTFRGNLPCGPLNWAISINDQSEINTNQQEQRQGGRERKEWGWGNCQLWLTQAQRSGPRCGTQVPKHDKAQGGPDTLILQYVWPRDEAPPRYQESGTQRLKCAPQRKILPKKRNHPKTRDKASKKPNTKSFPARSGVSKSRKIMQREGDRGRGTGDLRHLQPLNLTQNKIKCHSS